MSGRDEREPIESANRDALQALQLERLQKSVHAAYESIPHYKKKFAAAGVHPGDLKELADIAKFPFTTNDDLRQNYPFGMFAVPMADIVRVHASSGTTGKPTVVGYTERDIATWSLLMARSIRAAGGRSPAREVQLIGDFRPDIITVTPSYMLAIADEFERQGFVAANCSLRIGIFGAEPWTDSMRDEIERRMGLQ